MSQNRRKFIRIDAGNSPCQVRIGQTSVEAVLVNESIHGLCVGGLALMFLAVNQPIMIEYDGLEIGGRCRSAARDADGKFQIGVLKSEELSSFEIDEIIINSYVEFGGCKIICIPHLFHADGQVTVRLLDGKQFQLDHSQLTQYTRQERIESLQDDDVLEQLLGLYAALDDSKSWTGIEDIIGLEFPSALVSAGR